MMKLRKNDEETQTSLPCPWVCLPAMAIKPTDLGSEYIRLKRENKSTNLMGAILHSKTEHLF